MKKIKNIFYKFPILMTIALTCISAFLIAIVERPSMNVGLILEAVPLFTIITFPVILTIENIVFFIIKPELNKEPVGIKILEIIGILLGVFYSALLLSNKVVFADWNVQLYNSQRHTPISIDTLPTIITIAVVAFIGYLYLRFVPLSKQPPLATVLGMAAMYLGVAELVIWCIQIFNNSDFLLLLLYPFNCFLVVAKTIRYLVHQKLKIINEQDETPKYGRLSKLMNNIYNLPWLALFAVVPLLGIIIAILALFGQEPDSIIKAWTQTADWNLSQKIPPPNIIRDEHYLCTVAAGGHRNVVRPLRMGKRHGHEVIVNRQLCIANAFEQLLEERTPKFHRFVRNLYDRLGYPIAKHIHSPYAADIIYFIMKPLEWIFLVVLYLFDINPENRIAIQYPHSKVPMIK